MTDFSKNLFLKEFLSLFKKPKLEKENILNMDEDYSEFVAEILGTSLNKNICLVPFTESNEDFKYIQFELDDLWDNRALTELGYELVERVWNEGEFSVLGDSVVIWPFSGKELIRLSLWGKSIEYIDVVENESRRKVKSLKSVRIFDDSRNTVSGNQYAGDMLVLRYDNRPFSEEPEVVDISFRNIPNLNVHSSTKSSENIIADYKARGYKIWYVSKDLFKFEEDNILFRYVDKCFEVSDQVESSLKKGFVYEPAKLIVLTDTEVLGEINLKLSEKGKKLDPSSVEILKKIVPGDFVVHEDHGVGKFVGVTEKENETYLEIGYASNDRLFVPLKASTKLMKYIGSGKAMPTLTGLNSGVWKRISQKAKEDVENIAKELLRIYALREVSKTEAVIKDENDFDAYWRFANEFEFTDTEDQLIATKNIANDLKGDRPMDRLLVGDVGFGKTEIAMRATFAVANSGRQVAVLAPTTVLANQHGRVFKERFKKYPFNIQVLSRFQSEKEKQEVREGLEKGTVDIVIGTHTLLSKSIKFKNLGLIVVDEEQKFGVKQKEALKGSRINTHVLSMTATPIPRTLNMALMGVRDISVLAVPPAGRREIKNEFHSFDWIGIRNCIQREIERDGQVYYLHNRVSNIQFLKKKLENIVPDAKVEIAHGQLSGKALLTVMDRFLNQEIDVLLCTTIIENGLDISNANTLIVDDVNRLGLSQMYQIRGRVGRGDRQAYACFFFDKLKGDAALRLEAIRESQSLGSGFILSNRDLEIRGAGDILGKRQSGTINAVGYGLYTQLLKEAVDGLKGAK